MSSLNLELEILNLEACRLGATCCSDIRYSSSIDDTVQVVVVLDVTSTIRAKSFETFCRVGAERADHVFVGPRGADDKGEVCHGELSDPFPGIGYDAVAHELCEVTMGKLTSIRHIDIKEWPATLIPDIPSVPVCTNVSGMRVNIPLRWHSHNEMCVKHRTLRRISTT